MEDLTFKERFALTRDFRRGATVVFIGMVLYLALDYAISNLIAVFYFLSKGTGLESEQITSLLEADADGMGWITLVSVAIAALVTWLYFAFKKNEASAFPGTTEKQAVFGNNKPVNYKMIVFAMALILCVQLLFVLIFNGLELLFNMSQLENAPKETLDAYEDTKKMASKPYILWQLDFARVFREKGGFDIVIGNPPYFNIQTLGAQNPIVSSIMRRYSEIWMDKSDILFYFIYLGHLLSIGQVTYITSNAYLFSTKAKQFRNFIVEKMPIRKITNFENYMVFNSASITSCITFFEQKDLHDGHTSKAKVLSESSLPLSEVLYDDSLFFDISLKKDENFLLIPSDIRELDEKIKQGHPLLGTLLKVGKGMETAANNVFLFDEKPSFPAKYIRRRVVGDMIRRYLLSPPTQYLLYYEWASSFDELDVQVQSYLLENRSFLEDRATVRNEGRDWWRYSRPMHKEFYKYSKIWCSYRGTSNAFALDESDTLIGFTNTTAIFDTNEEIDVRYILALVNSKLLEYQHKRNAKQTGGGVFEYFPNTIERYPIPVISQSEQQPFVSLIDEILDSKKRDNDADTTKIEASIDIMVYKLYGLNECEIRVVEDYLKGAQ